MTAPDHAPANRPRSRRWWPWALAIVAAMLVFGVLLWFRQQPQPSLPTLTPVTGLPAAATPAIATGVFIEPGDGRQPILDEVADAQRSIDLEIYLITDEPVLQELEAAHRRGVAVRVILEQYPYGGGGRQPEIFNRLDAEGIAVRWGNPVFRFTHIKAMVIDDEVAVIMNQNLTDSSFRGNREFGVITTDPAAVGTAAAVFEADWTRGKEPDPEPLVVSPTNARAALRDLIVSAKTSLDIYAEVLRDPELLGAITDASARGVQVRLLVSPGPDNADARAALAAAGVQVRLLSNLYIHAKLIVADGGRAFVGSQNISATSLDLNRELGIVLADPVSLARLQRTFEVDFRSATPQE